MSKDAVIAGLLALPAPDQREILELLWDRLGENLGFSEEQERALDQRLDRFEREGSSGEPWEKVYKKLKASTNAHPDH